MEGADGANELVGVVGARGSPGEAGGATVVGPSLRASGATAEGVEKMGAASLVLSVCLACAGRKPGGSCR